MRCLCDPYAMGIGGRAIANAGTVASEVRPEPLDCKERSVLATPVAEPKFHRKTEMTSIRTRGTALAENAQDRPTKSQCS